MTENHSLQVANKMLKTSALLRNANMAKYIPETKPFSDANLRAMLAKYNTVIMKPVVGAGGHGLMRLSYTNGSYEFRHYAAVKHFSSLELALNHIHRIKKKRSYLIQRGIQLAAINGRPIDYRVKIMKKNGSWVITGMVGRVARNGLFVTNLCRGGRQLTCAQGIRQSLSTSAVTLKRNEMRRVAHTGTRVLEQRFPGIGELGFDFGIDWRGRIWIFEVNTRPQ